MPGEPPLPGQPRLISGGSVSRDAFRAITLAMARPAPKGDDRLLTPSEVAAMFRVDPKTVTRWAQAGKVSAIRTLGGHRRYREEEVRRLLER